MMRAVAIDRYGGPEQIQLMNLPVPQPAKDEVLVKIRAAGVNLVDTMVRSGYRAKNRFPTILGWDFAGIVERAGSAVSEFAPGDEVYGYNVESVQGTYAEYTTVPAAYTSKKSKRLTFIEAAALPCVGLTAYNTLVEHLGIQSGETVLITAASGGVGTVAVQIAKARGCRVIATASARNHEFLKGLGVDQAIDYTQRDWIEAVRERFPHGVDALMNCIGGETKRRSPSAVRDGGRLAWISGEEPLGPPMERSISGVFSFGFPKRATFEALTQLVDEGKLRVHVDRVYPLAQAREAQERIADGDRQGQVSQGHVRGKLVIDVTGATP
ncbi:MAG: NADP-dependent oxidoreductase [Acidobacteriaceae bacterium]|nr:NADP-dependent oxidoreductase [Acidobacteriaceae bacterium]